MGKCVYRGVVGDSPSVQSAIAQSQHRANGLMRETPYRSDVLDQYAALFGQYPLETPQYVFGPGSEGPQQRQHVRHII